MKPKNSTPTKTILVLPTPQRSPPQGVAFIDILYQISMVTFQAIFSEFLYTFRHSGGDFGPFMGKSIVLESSDYRRLLVFVPEICGGN